MIVYLAFILACALPITGQIASGFGYLKSLEQLNLFGSGIQAKCPHWFIDPSLRELWLQDNLLNGIFHESFRQISSLEYLDLSNNQLTGSLPDLVLFPSLRELNLRSKHFQRVIPECSEKLSELKILDASFNRLQGLLEGFRQLFNLDSFDAPFNLLEGIVYESHLSNLCKLKSELRIDNNHFTGSLNPICKLQSATILNLFENNLSGEVPDCWSPIAVPMVLNVANNHISGRIPYSLCSSISLSSLYVRKNNLNGQFPTSLKKCQGLKVLDLGRNTFKGNIPEWIGTTLAVLGILSIRLNKFFGSIPSSICQLQSIQILDLSGNHLSRRIPQGFSNFTTLQLLQDGSSMINDLNPYYIRGPVMYHGNAFVQWKNKESDYQNTLWLLETIDLSSNDLVGDYWSCKVNFNSLK
ncbi:putative receptor-like protein 12-like [Capsicum annuum]|uniref:Uncharacterized protein n=1 Tax=Capsicum annuum TaxID=4072 RepID=A0A2G2Z2D0_CAPAN|nr:putative receptor-like protein 12-like [Capsicum annuum]PHT76061.1 hypothetical protein T459_19583 [Capsicum annuum]